jgi:hypothetical protein
MLEPIARWTDNAAASFFVGLKNEFFRGRDWSGVGADESTTRLDEWFKRYRSSRLRAFREGAWLRGFSFFVQHPRCHNHVSTLSR